MKKTYWFAAAILLFISACGSPKLVDREAVASVVVKEEKIAKGQEANGQELWKSFSPYLSGVWVQADYIAEVIRTKSPFAASEMIGEISTVVIDPSKALEDSIDVGCSFGNHEGGDFHILFKQGSRQNLLKTNYPAYGNIGQTKEIGFQVLGKDTFLLIETFNKSKELIASVKYIKAYDLLKEEDDLSSGLVFLVMKNLIAGSYTYKDAKGNSRRVVFTPSGEVVGLPGIRDYYVNTDFGVTMENNLDAILFNVYKDDQKGYTFKIKADTLNLYKTYLSEDSVHLVQGALQYKFIRTSKQSF